jgi:DNA repair protein RecN (Recombination protein N)
MTLSAIEFVMGKPGDYPEGTAVEIGLLVEGEETVLRREVRHGRSRYFLNGRGTTAKTVREMMEDRISVQGQHEFIRLLREDYQRDLLDRFGNLTELRRRVEEVYGELLSKKRSLEELISRREEVLQRRDYLEYRLREIEEVGLTAEEVSRLRETAERLKHAERIGRLLNEALDVLYDGEGSAYDRISLALRALARAEDLAGSLGEVVGSLSEIRERLLEVVEGIRGRAEEVSQEEIDRVNEMLYRVQRIERKYGKPYEEILKERENLRRELEDLRAFDLKLEGLREEVELLERKLAEVCEVLSEERSRVARDIERSVTGFLVDLGLERSVLRIRLEKVQPGRFGSDRITFLFSAHGEDPRPLGEVASGGELTRLFLALSLILPPVETYIFDEVEAGISGEASVRLARMLRRISENMQIIAITHSAPLCAAGDVNFLTEKKFLGDIPYIEVRRISGEEKVREVARLMGTATEATLRGAEDLIRIVRS